MRTYSSGWPEIAAIVKEDADWNCQNCGHHHDPGRGYTLTVHHIDGNSLNDEPYNLVALCQRCHLHFQHPVHCEQMSFFDGPWWLAQFFAHVQSKPGRF